ncbi:MAG TPA: LptF/LptG family permease [Armatimonadota bacterium]
MKIAYRYIMRELLGPMLFGVAAFVSILLAGKQLMDLTRLAFEGVAFLDVAKLFLLALPPTVVFTLPMSMLLATLLGFGRMSGDSEMVAMYAGGMSLYRAAVPVVFLSLIVTGVTIVLNEKVVPWSLSTANDLRDRVEGQVKSQNEVEIRLPQYRGDKLVGIVRATFFNPRTGEMRGVSSVDYKNGEPVRVTYGASAIRKDDFHWTLRNGWTTDPRPDSSAPRAGFPEATLTIQQTVDEIRGQSKRISEMSMAELREQMKVYSRTGQVSKMAEAETAWWNRWSVPFASVVFAAIGLPLGLRPQRASGGLGLGLSIVIIFVYWVVWNSATRLGGYGTVSPFAAAWSANILGIGIGAALLTRAPK